ncbi:maspardin-like [Daktulosphaira vitifoliae]|uniref:maspardin-like n=1 Tax=Daktulosphaira vitifoliae TaxID=58002 RepID=UPI0021AAFAC1|nr:maspardin-like [Daktulosphaira vitifoliae]
MNFSSRISQSPEYTSFRSNIPLKKILLDDTSNKGWRVYDSGPRSVETPLIFLHPVSGTAEIYFKQLLTLSAKGYRVISAENPPYWSVTEWCEGFMQLLDYMDIKNVHLFGASLGGFLAQKFVEFSTIVHQPKVVSLFLCNTFTDTSIFRYKEAAVLFWIFPSVILKKMVLSNFSTKEAYHDRQIADSLDFMVEVIESLSQSDLASRLTINCLNSRVNTYLMRGLKAVTIMDVFDNYALGSPVRENIYKEYPQAKLAQLKTGGNFPYLSRSDEVNLHLQIHLRNFDGTPFSASDNLSIDDSIKN